MTSSRSSDGTPPSAGGPRPSDRRAAGTASAREVAEAFLDRTVHAFDELADLYGDRVVIEMPFADPLFPPRRETSRDELRSAFAAGSSHRRYTAVDRVSIHETTDPAVVVLEYDLHGERLPAGDPFSLTYIMVMTVTDGLIVHSRDYGSPIAAARAFGQLPALITALTDA